MIPLRRRESQTVPNDRKEYRAQWVRRVFPMMSHTAKNGESRKSLLSKVRANIEQALERTEIQETISCERI